MNHITYLGAGTGAGTLLAEAAVTGPGAAMAALLTGASVIVVVTVTTRVVAASTVLGQTYVSVVAVPDTVAGPVQRAGSAAQSSRAAIAGAQAWSMGAPY